MAAVGQLTIEMAANVARLRTDMEFARKTVHGAMDSISKSAATAMKALGALGLAVAAVSAIKGFAGFVQGAIEAADQAHKLGQKTGIATSQVAGLQLAFRQGGVEAQSMQSALAKLSVGVLNGNSALKAMGIQTRDAHGELKSTREILGQVAERFEGYSDGVAKTALAVELFGKSGADLIPVLNGGATGLDEYDRMAAKLGLTISEQTGKSAAAFNDTIDLMGQGLTGIGSRIAAQLLPTLESLAGKFFESMTEGDRLKTVSDVLSGTLKGLYAAALITADGFNILGTYFGGYAKAFGEFASGNFSAAWAAIGETGEKVVAIGRKSVLDLTAVFKDAGDQTVATLARVAAGAKNTTPEIGALADSARQSALAYDKMLKSADALLASLKFEAQALGMSNVEKETAVALQKLLNTGLKEGTAEYKKYAEAVVFAVLEKEQMQKLAELRKKDLEDRKRAEEKALAERLRREKDFADEVKTINNQIGQSLTDALMSGGLTARDFLVNMFKTMVLRPLLQPVMAGLVGMFTSGAASALGSAGAEGATGGSITGSLGLLGAASSLKSTYGMLSGGFAGLGKAVSEFATSAGAWLQNGAEAGSLMRGAGASLAESAGALGSAASALSGAAAGFGLGMMISGDKALVGGKSMYSVGGGVAAGAALGSVVPVIGTAFGALVGGLLGGLANQFGKGPKKTTDTWLVGSLSANGASVSTYQDWQQKGGWFSKGGRGSVFSAAEGKLTRHLNQSIAASALAVKNYAEVLGLPAQGIADFTLQIKRSLKDLSPDAAAKAIEELLAAYGNGLAAAVTPEIGPFQRAGEEAGATLTRLGLSLKTVNQVFDTLNITLMETSLQSADASSKLIDMFGSVDAFLKSTDYYYQNFYTEQERATKTTEQLTKVFSQLGLTLPATNAAFRSMVEAARAAGNDGLFSTLIKLAPTFNELQVSLANIAAASAQATAAISGSGQALSKSADRALKRAQDSAQALADATVRATEHAIEQALSDASKAVDATFGMVKLAIDHELKATLAIIEQQKALVTASKQLAQECVSSLKSIFSYLKDQIASILQNVAPVQSAAQANAFLREALRIAKTTGSMPEQTALSEAVSAARTGLSPENFATALEMKRGNLRLAADLRVLQDLAGEQQSVAESQLELATNQLATLDAQAETAQAYYANQLQLAQDQVNELRGINNSVLTVAEAMSSLGAALNTSRTVASASVSSGSNLTAQITQMYLEFLGRTPEAAGLQNWLNSGRDAAGIREGIVNSDEYRARHGGIPAYANGGAYPGGLAMVGEQGPELINFARPGQVYTAGQTANILGGGTEVAEEIRGLRQECQTQARAMVQLQNRMTRLLERWDGSGMPETREVSA